MVTKIISVGHWTNRHFEVLRQWARRHFPVGTDTPFHEVINRLDRCQMIYRAGNECERSHPTSELLATSRGDSVVRSRGSRFHGLLEHEGPRSGIAPAKRRLAAEQRTGSSSQLSNSASAVSRWT